VLQSTDRSTRKEKYLVVAFASRLVCFLANRMQHKAAQLVA
jgi:hypothetical protein